MRSNRHPTPARPHNAADSLCLTAGNEGWLTKTFQNRRFTALSGRKVAGR
jgi:hypothetical protein